MPIFPWTFTAGDTLPLIAFVFPYDITSHTVTLEIRRPGDVLRITGTITDAVNGKGFFQWVTGSLQPGLSQLCDVTIVDGSGQKLTSKRFIINVDDVIQ